MKINRSNQHIIKHIDSTDLPVCLFKNANNHKTMKGLANFGRSSKGIYFGLKLHKHQRVLFAKPRVNMKKIRTKFQECLYGTRMLIELNFRNLNSNNLTVFELFRFR